MTTQLTHPSMNVLNRAKVDHSAPADRLNRAKGVTHREPFMGVHPPATIENAKVSALPKSGSLHAFSHALDQASENRTALSEERQALLEKKAATVVNQVFMGTMLKEMRQSPFKVDSLSGGKGGEAYAGLFDQHIAEGAGNHIAKSLVKSMVKQYVRTASAKGIAS